MSALTDEQREILRHALGLNRRPEPYRRYVVASEGAPDHSVCCELVDAGFMTRRVTPLTAAGMELFIVTEAGHRRAMLAERERREKERDNG